MHPIQPATAPTRPSSGRATPLTAVLSQWPLTILGLPMYRIPAT